MIQVPDFCVMSELLMAEEVNPQGLLQRRRGVLFNAEEIVLDGVVPLLEPIGDVNASIEAFVLLHDTLDREDAV